MEKYFGNAYRGDPGVPHCDPDCFSGIWLGSAIYAVVTWNYPYFWTLAPQNNFHDKAMLYEQHHWRKTLKGGKQYEFLWNKVHSKKVRDSYYFNWPVYFN